MRDDFSLEELGTTLPGLKRNPRTGEFTHAGQSWEPAIEKVAYVFARYPIRTLAALMFKASEINRIAARSQAGSIAPGPAEMLPGEHALLADRLEGRGVQVSKRGGR